MTELTPESVSAIADKVIDEKVVSKKIPAPDDIAGQESAVVGALASALLTATDMPLTAFQPIVGALAKQLVALGIRQTDLIDPSAVRAPGWMVGNVRQNAVEVPEQPVHTEAEPYTARTAEAPQCPDRIRKSARAVHL